MWVRSLSALPAWPVLASPACAGRSTPTPRRALGSTAIRSRTALVGPILRGHPPGTARRGTECQTCGTAKQLQQRTTRDRRRFSSAGFWTVHRILLATPKPVASSTSVTRTARLENRPAEPPCRPPRPGEVFPATYSLTGGAAPPKNCHLGSRRHQVWASFGYRGSCELRDPLIACTGEGGGGGGGRRGW